MNNKLITKLSLLAALCVVLLGIVGCARESVRFPSVSAAEQASAMSKWARSCALCHVNGEGGAPKVGDASAWKPRLAQSTEDLLGHMVAGHKRMPPLGYCMDCSEQDLLVMAAFMAGKDKRYD